MRFTDNERNARYEKFGSDFEPSKKCQCCDSNPCLEIEGGE